MGVKDVGERKERSPRSIDKATSRVLQKVFTDVHVDVNPFGSVLAESILNDFRR